jgi:replicative DNA helicase
MNNFELEANLLQVIVKNPFLIGILDVKDYYFTDKNCEAYWKKMVELTEKSRKFSKGDIYIFMREAGFDPVSIESAWNPEIDETMAGEYLKKIKEKYVTRELKKAGKELGPHDNIFRAKELEVELEEKEILAIDELSKKYKENWKEKKDKLSKDGTIGVVTGFNFLDEDVILERKKLVTLAALPSVGKTTMSLNIAVNAAMFGQNVLYFSIEMDENEMIDKILSQLTGIGHSAFKGVANDSILETGMNEMKELKDNLKLLHLPRATSTDICLISRKESLKRPVDLIIVDYLQFLRDPVQKGMNKTQVIGEMCKNFKGLSSQTNSLVIMNAQFNRTAALNSNEIPKLHQLRESGDIEQDSDIVLILHRVNRGATDAVVKAAKVRGGQAEGVYNLNFFKDKSTFKQKPISQQTSIKTKNLAKLSNE